MSIEVHTAEKALEKLMEALCVMDGRIVGPGDKAFRDIAMDALACTSVLSLYLAELAKGDRTEVIDPEVASRILEQCS